jgi:hypothetical protein
MAEWEPQREVTFKEFYGKHPIGYLKYLLSACEEKEMKLPIRNLFRSRRRLRIRELTEMIQEREKEEKEEKDKNEENRKKRKRTSPDDRARERQ